MSTEKPKSETSAPAKPAAPARGKLIKIAVIAGILFAAWFFWGHQAPATTDNNTSQAGVVVVLDAPLLAMLQLRAVQDNLADVADAQNSAADFAGRMAEILDEYREAGILVINKSGVLAVPTMSDITPLVAKRLNIDLDQAHDAN